MSLSNTRPVHVAAQRATIDRRADGVVYVSSVDALRAYPARVTDRLEFWAKEAPGRVFLAQRSPSGEWECTTYAEAWNKARKLAAGLLRLGLSQSRPLVILSGNSMEHGLLAL